MMNKKFKIKNIRINFSKSVVTLLTIVTIVLVFLLIYQASIPTSYDLKIGSIAEEDILLNRAVVDHQKTKDKAERQASLVLDVYHRSQDIADKNINNIDDFYAKIGAKRALIYAEIIAKNQELEDDKNKDNENKDKNTDKNNVDENNDTNLKAKEMDKNWLVEDEFITEQAEELINKFPDLLNGSITKDDIKLFLSVPPSIYTMIESNTKRLASYIVKDNLTSANIGESVDKQVKNILNNDGKFQAEYDLIGKILINMITPNLVYDQEATELARKDSFDSAQAQPIMIEKGTRVVLRGDKITEDTYQILKDADLINSGKLDWQIILGVLICVIMIFLLIKNYMRYQVKSEAGMRKQIITILVTMLIPFAIAAYGSQFSKLMAPVYFATVIFTAYYGMRLAMILSASLVVLVFPLTNMNYHFLFCSVVGIMVCSMVTNGFTKRDKYAFVILLTAVAPTTASLALDLIMKTTPNLLFTNALTFFIVGALSAVAAIGMMPLYEIMLNTVSPLRLIELSNPNQPLLKRMLFEAPGTSQHSNMVANLAEIAAESIGADALLTRVGALYHDIGKMENSSYFTENQHGENPHDYISPEESAKIILGHVTDSVKMAHRNGLPEELIAFMVEHHGDTLLVSIYAKACKLAETQGLPMPNPDDFCYPGRIPQTKETGIVMIADSVEAAMKSTGYRDLKKAEELMRKIVKSKNDQNQLVDSGLSYKEVEEVIQAFLRVYEGQFHERIKYPDANLLPKKKL